MESQSVAGAHSYVTTRISSRTGIDTSPSRGSQHEMRLNQAMCKLISKTSGKAASGASGCQVGIPTSYDVGGDFLQPGHIIRHQR